MLDAFYIFTKGGLVLFAFQLAALRGEPVEALIRTCLLEERAGDAAFSYAADGAAYALKWTFHNEAALVFVAVRRAALPVCCAAGALRARTAGCGRAMLRCAVQRAAQRNAVP